MRWYVLLMLAATACTTPATPRAAAPSGTRTVTAAPASSAAPAGSRAPRLPAGSPASWLTRTPTPSPTAAEDPWAASGHDGRPGYSGMFGGCADATALPGRGTAPFRDVSLRLEPPASLRGGRIYTAHAVITNTGSRYLRFDVQADGSFQAVLLDAAGRHGSELRGSDAINVMTIDLAPGGTTRLDVDVVTRTCGDGATDPEPPLPPGTYRLGFAVRWTDSAAGPSPSPSARPSLGAEWGIAPLTVRVG